MDDRAQVLLKRLKKKMKRGYRGDPVATVAFYGPDNKRASKVVVGIGSQDGATVQELRKWFSETGDIRNDAAVLEEVTSYLQSHGAMSVVMTPGIWGCPHEEGIDYPSGEFCPQCPFWRGRDRHAFD